MSLINEMSNKKTHLHNYVQACMHNDISMLDSILKDYIDCLDMNAVHSGIAAACYKGHLDVIKKIVTHEKLIEKIDFSYKNNLFLNLSTTHDHQHILEFFLSDKNEFIDLKNIKADNWRTLLYSFCQHGSIKSLTFFSTDNIIKNFIDVRFGDDHLLYLACQNNQKEIAKFLLTSDLLDNHCQIFTTSYKCFNTLCRQGHIETLDMIFSEEKIYKKITKEALNYALTICADIGKLDTIKYLLDKSKLIVGENCFDIHYENDLLFKTAACNHHHGIVEHLICNLFIDCTPAIQNFISQPEYQYIEEIFRKRILYDTLQENLEKYHSIKNNIKQKI